MRFGTALLVVFLIAILGGTAWFVIDGLTTETTVGVSMHGYIAMTLGILFSLIIGVSLMVLVFYSSRHGYDEPARRAKLSDLPPKASPPPPS
ncbi:MAG TPA: hypothetical protein VNZ94_08260 [Xanthobacteraceae bacterium]|nr:hypothetical protein [Xanthobacteraceae bacterium]